MDNKNETKPRKKPVRRLFARVKGVEVGGRIYKFELTKAGLEVRQRNHRAVQKLGFPRLTNGGGFEVTVENRAVKFALTEHGLEIATGKRVKLLTYVELANHGRDQAELFPELARATEARA